MVLPCQPFPHLRNILGGIPEQDVAVAEDWDLERGSWRVILWFEADEGEDQRQDKARAA